MSIPTLVDNEVDYEEFLTKNYTPRTWTRIDETKTDLSIFTKVIPAVRSDSHMGYRLTKREYDKRDTAKFFEIRSMFNDLEAKAALASIGCEDDFNRQVTAEFAMSKDGTVLMTIFLTDDTCAYFTTSTYVTFETTSGNTYLIDTYSMMMLNAKNNEYEIDYLRHPLMIGHSAMIITKQPISRMDDNLLFTSQITKIY